MIRLRHSDRLTISKVYESCATWDCSNHRRKKVHLYFPFEENAHEPQGESRQSPTERGRLDLASARELREPGIKMVTRNIFLFSKKSVIRRESSHRFFFLQTPSFYGKIREGRNDALKGGLWEFLCCLCEGHSHFLTKALLSSNLGIQPPNRRYAQVSE